MYINTILLVILIAVCVTLLAYLMRFLAETKTCKWDDTREEVTDGLWRISSGISQYLVRWSSGNEKVEMTPLFYRISQDHAWTAYHPSTPIAAHGTLNPTQHYNLLLAPTEEQSKQHSLRLEEMVHGTKLTIEEIEALPSDVKTHSVVSPLSLRFLSQDECTIANAHWDWCPPGDGHCRPACVLNDYLV